MIRDIRAPTGCAMSCKTWGAEAAFRMIQNNLDPAVAENPDELIVYGSNGKAARDWNCYQSILNALKALEPDQTLLVQSGKPIGIASTSRHAPRVLIANSNLVPRWATWEHFHELDRKGLMMFGQMTAGSWIYIGSQGIIQGTYETFSACGRKHFGAGDHPLKGRIVVSAGLGGMGGAQPLAAKLAGAAFLGVDVDADRIRRRIQTGYLDEMTDRLEDAISLVSTWAAAGKAGSVGLVANIADIMPAMVKRGFCPDVITDQTSAHDPLNGYIPSGYSIQDAEEARNGDTVNYLKAVRESVVRHVSAMLELKSRGSIVFDYGNNLRALAFEAGLPNALDIPGFIAEYIRPLFCRGCGPFRYVALSGDRNDIEILDNEMLKLFPDNRMLHNWLRHGAPAVPFQGLPARICWLDYRERALAGIRFNELVKAGIIKAPVVIGRDHLDGGSVASPYRETENMMDGSDAISDWPVLNALLNTANGADWVSFHHGGGVGMGYSQHAGMVVVADGSDAASDRLHRVLTGDPLMGVLRHADAGYPEAIHYAHSHDIPVPMIRP